MGNVLSEQDRQQVIALGRLGWSLRRIEHETGVRRETASGYLRAAGVAVRGVGRPSASKPAISVITDPSAEPKPAISTITDPEPPRPSLSECEVHRAFIEESLGKGRNAMAIWQDLVDRHGFSARYSSVLRFVRTHCKAPQREPFAVIVTAPGEEGQVDYGDGPMVRNRESGRYKRTRLFVFTLGYSRKCVRLLVWKSSSKTWAQLHEQAFRRLGGAPSVVVLDNLKEGVLKPEVYDPALNPLFRDVLMHYGVAALPCRVRDPNRKGKVERGVGHAKQTPLKGMRFESLEEAQGHLDRWEERWADTRIHGTTKRQVLAMFNEEKPALKPLPVEPFRYYEFGLRRVHTDGCVEVSAAYYGAPPIYMGKDVLAQWDERVVRLLDPKTGSLLREHLRTRRGVHSIVEGDRMVRTPYAIKELLAQAERVGPNAGRLCDAIWRRDGQAGVRRIQGVLSHGKRHGLVALEDACHAACELGSPNYQFIKRYLARRHPLHATLKQVDPLIRELSHYKALIERITEGDGNESNRTSTRA
jgi:transposase